MKTTDIDWIDMTLAPEEYRSESISDRIKGIISVGKPFAADAVDLAKAKQQQPDGEILLMNESFKFRYLNFPLNIKPDKDHEIRLLVLDATILSEDNSAICWSLDPIRVDNEVKVTAGAKFNAKLGLKVFEGGGEQTAGQEYISYQPSIEAFGLRESNPSWEITRTEGRKISGIMLFHMVVRVPKETSAKVDVRLKADIFRKGALWTYHVVNLKNDVHLFELDL